MACLCGVVSAGCAPQRVPAEWTLAAEEIGRVGDGTDPAEAFYEPAVVRVDGAGRLHVLDTGNDRVQVFDVDGRYLRTLGRSGEGPGDLSRPMGMWVFGDGEVVIADSGNARLQRFGPGGDPLPAVGLDFVPLDVVGTDRYLFTLRLPPPTFIYGPGSEPLIHRTDRDGSPLDAFLEPEAAEVGILYFLRNTLRLAAGPGEGIAVAHTHVVSRIRRFAATGAPEGAIDVLYKAQAMAPLGRLPRRVNDSSLASVARTCTALEWDARRGTYWVLAGYVDRRRDGSWVSATELYRYRPDGRYAGSVMLPWSARSVAAAHDGTLWVLDSDGVAHRLRLEDPEMVPASTG
jgi:hypothetical protein